ncbi:flagellin [Selenomonas sp. WCT3]|uniref:flagellin n=1 Tax=Selenomonas sp. WCT3 TaxID=3158785 RepID=UPI00399AE3A5
MDPFERALEALSKLDDALEYSLNENTRMGAYQTRLSFVIDNLTVASESTQASESVIRDANMAKEMTIYTKNNVLSQSAQAMLAQANQNSSSVLSLLQG